MSISTLPPRVGIVTDAPSTVHSTDCSKVAGDWRVDYVDGNVAEQMLRSGQASLCECLTVIECRNCGDEFTCQEHSRQARVRCGRCAGTGAFVTGSLNGKPTGPGGHCYRCNGKGFHTFADRKRNYGYAMSR